MSLSISSKFKILASSIADAEAISEFSNYFTVVVGAIGSSSSRVTLVPLVHDVITLECLYLMSRSITLCELVLENLLIVACPRVDMEHEKMSFSDAMLGKNYLKK